MLKKLIKGTAIIAAAFAFFLSITPFETFASVRAAEAKITITKHISGIEETDEVFTFQISADDEAFPMPDNAELTIEGTGKASFDIRYGEVGIYTYTVREIAGSGEYCTYDDTVYAVSVYVLWDEENAKLVTVVVCADENDYKTEAVFTNVYTPPAPPPTPTPTTPPAPTTGDASKLIQGLALTAVAAICIFAATYLLKKRRTAA